ncbi:hypothetical protein QC762_400500 [Podospora pseudocomata]|uniref:Copper acquisition factor BIM1-like domain-containing protein n=2 Tax=Podospora TaxID=5144 RepID=A0ABR0GEA2_9PEZI|nr:hypothetical protein QC762_400500 [Podospora pseudocomata]KAK4676418.1 hypothetical protein QC764_400500 [Podospora pseudoanserina]
MLFILTTVLAHVAQAHVVVTYPGWRANNLVTNATFPFGMQWMYPCDTGQKGGGVSPTTNRTYWPISGGAVALQPGWFQGHETALIYINLGIGEKPENYSFPLTKFYINGPTNNPYPGTVCIPKLDVPGTVWSTRIKSGDRASVQVVEASSHGAGQFSCSDIIFTDDPALVPQVNETNCFNSTEIKVSSVYLPGTPPNESCSTPSVGESGRGNLFAGVDTPAAAETSVATGGAEGARVPVMMMNLVVVVAGARYIGGF